MAGFQSPAFLAFIAQIEEQAIFAQVLITRTGSTFQLRHADDKDRPGGELKKITAGEIRAFVDFTAAGEFRPLKSAPNLRTGWIFSTVDESELELVLNRIYPNAVADWFLVRNGSAPITHYRDFTRRQSGMYRITTMLSDSQAADVIRACCHKQFCLKQRLWSVEGLPTDPRVEKSDIPCLEPCAILLEFARKGMRIEQEEKVQVPLSGSDLASVKAALELALQVPPAPMREADFAQAENPRRIQLALEKLKSFGNPLANATEGE